jgi:uncharacterized membrane protein
MDNYEVLGVGKNSSKEEIKLAYENKVKNIDEQVVNKKNADAFKKVLKEAYDGISSSSSALNNNGQASENTMVMSKEELNKLLDSAKEEDEYNYYDDYQDKKSSKKREKKTSSSSGKNKKKKHGNNGKSKENSNNRKRKSDGETDHEKEELGLLSILLIPFKILALPVIIVLSVIIFILDLISAAIWIVSKVLLVASVAAASIYGYQVYTGSADIRYDVIAACGAAFIASICLPLVPKVLTKPLKLINDTLKDFVF